MPGIGAYCATKALVSNFAEGLHFEVRHKIDVTCWEPGACSTNLLTGENKPPGAITMTPKKAVTGALS